MSAHSPMRWTAYIALSLAALAPAVAAAAPAAVQSSTHRRSEHDAASRHPGSGRTVPRRHGTPEHRVSSKSERESERSRLAAEHHVSPAETSHERYEAERHARYEAELRARYEAEHKSRLEDELSARYEEGYQAGLAAGAAAARKRIAAAAECRTAPARSPAGNAANLAPAAPSGQNAQSSYAVQSATYDTTQAVHHPPVTMEASLLMLREPMPPPMRGSLASLVRQNRRLDAEGLERIRNDADLEERIAEKQLVPLPVSDGLIVNPSLPVLRRYCRPWTAQFLTDLARIHDALFHRPLQVDSAVRPVSYQRQLMRVNGNAAPAEGEIASPHETGATIDIAKRGMTLREIGWMRSYLLDLQNAGLVDVEEEFEQACFHITVYRTYAHPGPLRHSSSPNDDADSASIAADAPGQ